MSQNNLINDLEKLIKELSSVLTNETSKSDQEFKQTQDLLDKIKTLKPTDRETDPEAFQSLQSDAFKWLQFKLFLLLRNALTDKRLDEIENSFNKVKQLTDIMQQFNNDAWLQLANPEAWCDSFLPSEANEFNLFLHAIKLDVRYVMFFNDYFPNELQKESSAQLFYKEAIRCNKLSIFNHFNATNSKYLENHSTELLSFAIEVSDIELVKALLESSPSTEEFFTKIQLLDNLIEKLPSKAQTEDKKLELLLNDIKTNHEKNPYFLNILNRSQRQLATKITENIEKIAIVKTKAKYKMETEFDVEEIQKQANKDVESCFKNIEQLFQLSSSLKVEMPSDFDVFHQSICYGDEEVLEFFIKKYHEQWDTRINDINALIRMIKLSIKSDSKYCVQYLMKITTAKQSSELLKSLYYDEKDLYLKSLLLNIKINQEKIQILLSTINNRTFNTYLKIIKAYFQDRLVPARPFTAWVVKEMRALFEIKFSSMSRETKHLVNFITEELTPWNLELIIQHADYDDYLFFSDLKDTPFKDNSNPKYLFMAAVRNEDANILNDLFVKFIESDLKADIDPNSPYAAAFSICNSLNII